MANNPLQELHDAGQSIWYDNVRRGLITSGELKRMIAEDAVTGVTSNPTIFEKAIAGSSDYDDAIDRLIARGASVAEIYDDLVLEDIRNVADLLRPIYDQTGGLDGYVSIEEPPDLANDTARSIEEGKRLFDVLQRPNVMIKVPATPEGIPAVEELIAAGVNVNITLIFALSFYERVIEAYLRGLERRAAAGQPIDRIGSVASFFVSRVDSEVDKRLEAKIAEAPDEATKQKVRALLGKAAIANAKLAYERFTQRFAGPRWDALRAQNANVQRPLWASTSTKNPAYPDVYYVEALIGPYTVDTMPPQTVTAFKDHGEVARSIDEDVPSAHAALFQLEQAGISMTDVTDKLLADGVKSFADSYNQLIEVINQRRSAQLAAKTATGA